MSKGLEALERIKKSPDSYRKSNFKYTYGQDLDTLENEFKRLEEYDKVFRGEVFLNNEKTGLAVVESLVNKIQKLEYALEIIKKEIRGCLEFCWDEEHDYGEVWCIQNEEESRVLIASANSKEEYELLKEVLL